MKKITISALAAIAIFACAKTETPTSEQLTENIEVSFNASQVIVTEATKASKADPDPALPNGTKALVSVYAPGGAYDGTTNKVLAKEYTAGADGVLVSDGGTEMLIPMGIYDFLSIGVMGEGTMPTMTATEVTGMINGVDYIATNVNKQLSTGGKTVDLDYKHLTSRIVIDVIHDATALDEVTSITSMTITPSVGPWTVALAKLATPATVNQVATVSPKATQVPMTVTGKTASFMMIPVVAGQQICFTIKAQVKPKGSTNAVPANYTGQITVPEGGYTGGNQYGYKATVSSGTVAFSNATVSGWGVGNPGGVAQDVPTVEE